MIFLLDNGHGIDTPGKRSPVWPNGSQLLEYYYSREIVKRIHDALIRHEINSIILIPEIIDIPLEERCYRADDHLIDGPCLLISVHVNASPQESRRPGDGWEIWTSKGETVSDIMAEYFCDAALKHLVDFRMRFERTFPGDGRDKDGNFKILRNTVCWAVLTENLFMDNEKECKYLLSDAGKQAIVDLHVEAMRNIYKDYQT